MAGKYRRNETRAHPGRAEFNPQSTPSIRASRADLGARSGGEVEDQVGDQLSGAWWVVGDVCAAENAVHPDSPRRQALGALHVRLGARRPTRAVRRSPN